MLRTRIVTGLILGALLLLGLFQLPKAWAVVAFGVVFTLAAWEWAGFGALAAPAAKAAYAAAIAAMLGVSWAWTDRSSHLMMLLGAACAWWVFAFVWLTLAPERHQPLLTLLCGVPVLAPAFVALAHLVASTGGFAGGKPNGPQAVLWLVLMVCAADIGAYFAGRSFGRRKLAPRVSPGKTWEGAAGGLVMVILVAWAGAAYFSLPVLLMVAFGCAVGVFSIVGDLTESMFKRAASLKDSGTLLPGHGGLLDRLDSVTAAAPLYALGLFGSGVIP
jgi:phosphatidate cytidylyltransferase